MRNLFSFFVISLIMLSCSGISQFQENIGNLSSEWGTANTQMEELANMVDEEQSRLNDLLAQAPRRVDLVGNFGEDYLARADQLSARLVGHKGRFDELANQVRDYGQLWAEQQSSLDQLRAGLEAGALPRNTQEQIRMLQAFLSDGQEKMGTWQAELKEVIGQFDLAAAQLDQ